MAMTLHMLSCDNALDSQQPIHEQQLLLATMKHMASKLCHAEPQEVIGNKGCYKNILHLLQKGQGIPYPVAITNMLSMAG